MLHSVEISNFRSCQSIQLKDIGGVLALVGRNGAGKTNILRAIEWAASTATNAQPLESGRDFDIFEVLRGRLPKVILKFSPECGTKCEYSIEVIHDAPSSGDGDSKRGQFRLILKESFSRDSQQVITRLGEKLFRHDTTQELSLGASTPFLKVLLAILPETDKLFPLLSDVVSYLENIRYYSPEFSAKKTDYPRLIPGQGYRDWADGIKKNGPSGSVVMRLLHLYLVRTDEFDEVASLVGEDGLDLVSSINVDPISLSRKTVDVVQNEDLFSDPPLPDFYHVAFTPSGFEESEQKRPFAFEELSFGTQRLLSILTAMVFDHSSVFLLEQPEDGIHVGLLHKLQPLFQAYSDKMQFVIASHSRDVLDRFGPLDIRLVTIVNGQTIVRALEPHEVKIAERFMDEEGPLSDFIETLQGDQ